MFNLTHKVLRLINLAVQNKVGAGLWLNKEVLEEVYSRST